MEIRPFALESRVSAHTNSLRSMKKIDATTILSESAEQTQAVAASLARRLPAGSVLALHGDLGAGKTCFVQGLASGLHVQQPVSSPTYTLVHEYGGDVPLYHIDLYRLQGAEDALDMGLDEYMEGAGITAIEWPERAASALPAETVHIRLEHGEAENQRRIIMDAGWR